MSRKKDYVNRLVMNKKKFPPVMYGLQGIMDLFGVRKTTAWRYHKGILADACTKRGKRILIDTRKALMLYGVKDIDNLVSSNK